MVEYNPNLLKSVLLLVLAVSGNFVGNTLGCQTQNIMTNNMYLKHALIVFITFFTLNYTAEENENPTKQMTRAVGIWLCYLLFTKQNLMFTSLSAGLLCAAYVIDSFSKYYQTILDSKKSTLEITNELQSKVDSLNQNKNYAFNAGILVIGLGFVLYMRDKYNEYGSNFNLLTFIFGKTNCKSFN